MAVGREDYEERKEQKIERFNKRASKAAQDSDAAYNRSHELASVIPMGQPIMVGHHSEKGHRALLAKVESTFRKSMELSDKSEYYKDRAKIAASNRAISGDNPEALDLYRKKLEGLEESQEQMKAVNKAFKKGGSEAAKVSMEGFGYSEKMIANILDTSKWVLQDRPFASYALTNNNANIRTVRQKIEALEKLSVRESGDKITFKGGELVENTEANRVQFIFDGKPGEEIRKLLKSYGFRWAPSEGAWQRQRTLNAISVSKRLIPEIERLVNGGK